MTYEMEALAKTLKQARKAKQLSQRELSKRTGVPQSHISKIEKSGVDLRVSSLNAIANALDLELALVPRKAVPAVKSISRTAITPPTATADVSRTMSQIAKQMEGIKTLDIDLSAVERLQRHFRELKQFQNLIRDASQLSHVNELVKAVRSNGGLEAAKRAADQMAEIRNTLAHANSKLQSIEHSQPKYHLDGDDDG